MEGSGKSSKVDGLFEKFVSPSKNSYLKESGSLRALCPAGYPRAVLGTLPV